MRRRDNSLCDHVTFCRCSTAPGTDPQWSKAERTMLARRVPEAAFAATWKRHALSLVGYTITRPPGPPQSNAAYAAAIKAQGTRSIVTAFDLEHRPKAWHCRCVACERQRWDEAVGT